MKFSTIDVFMFHTYNNCYYGTCGDGNCLYRACSKLLCGKEDLCYFLRGFTSIELYSNQEFYAFNPYVQENAHIFWCENIAFSASMSLADMFKAKSVKQESNQILYLKVCILTTTTTTTTTITTTTTTRQQYTLKLPYDFLSICML